MKTTLKHYLTTQPYKVEYRGYEITVPAKWPVSNGTACGPDDNCRFAGKTKQLAAQVTGLPDSMLAHDLKYYGLPIPAEICEEMPTLN